MYIYMFCIDVCVSLCLLMHIHMLFMLNVLYVGCGGGECRREKRGLGEGSNRAVVREPGGAG